MAGLALHVVTKDRKMQAELQEVVLPVSKVKGKDVASVMEEQVRNSEKEFEMKDKDMQSDAAEDSSNFERAEVQVSETDELELEEAAARQRAELAGR